MEWLKNLPGEALVALELALPHLSKLELLGEKRTRWLLTVDIALHAHHQELSRLYANTRRLNAEEEARMWHAGYTFHEGWARAYLGALQDTPASSNDAKPLAARMLYHRGRAAVWRSFRYLTPPFGWWLDLHKIYALTEQEGFADIAYALYPEEDSVSCETLYLRILMLETLNLSNMTRPQILAADTWLQSRIHNIALESQFREANQLFYVDLGMDRGGRRIRNLKPAPGYRYWETDSVVAAIEYDLLDDAHEALDNDVLRAMHSEWSRTTYKRQRRSDDRRETTRRATVAHGIYAACQEVLSQATGITAEIGGEIWQIESTSNHGIGAVVSTDLNIWLQIGCLIVLREEISFGMSVVGVIRNLKHQEAGKIYVGAEILSYMAMYGALQPVRATPGSQTIPCIFISSDDHQLKLSLLLPAIEYETGAEFFLRLDNRVHRIRFQRLMEQKDDWVRVEIEVLKHLVAVPKTAKII